MKNLREKIEQLERLDYPYTVNDLERDLGGMELTEAVDVLAAASRKFSEELGLGGRELNKYIARFVKSRLDQATDVTGIYEILYKNFPRQTVEAVAASEQAWRNLNSLFGFQGSLEAPVGKELLELLLPAPRNAVYGETRQAIDIVTAAINQGIFQEHETYLQDFAARVRNEKGFSDTGRQRIFEYLERRLSEAERSEGEENKGQGLRKVNGRFWGQKVYYGGECLGLYCDVMLDPSGKPRWVTEEVIDRDFTGVQKRITLWEYDEGRRVPVAVSKQCAYPREGTLPSPAELFEGGDYGHPKAV